MLGVLISFLVLVPFLMVFLNSMKSKRQANLLELSLTGISWNQFLENYGTVIREARLVSSSSMVRAPARTEATAGRVKA